ncbi:MAG: PQQ-binding-like beta-propeller repeat protein [Thaumarchaeota archaeon]|nr:PQQ-binding-like beta-propeller repeat protein [Nitrososphaerota archaeon]
MPPGSSLPPLASTLGVAAVVFLLASSSSLGSIRASPSADPQTSQSSANWIGPDGNYPFNWDYSPQTAINLTSVNDLGLKWLYPLPGPRIPNTLGSSVIVTPIIVQGAVYYITSSDLLIAQDASDGALLWSKNLSLDYDYPGLGVLPESANLQGHYHAIWYTTLVRGLPLVWVAGDNYTVFAFNAASGAEALKLDYLPVDVPGNHGYYDPGGKQVVVDQGRGILTVTTSDSEGTDAGRGFFEGWNVTANSPTLLWRTFLMPPQDGSDPLWSINSVQNASYAWVFNGTAQVNLKALSNSTLYGMLYGDWGSFGFNGTQSYAGMDGGWGGSDAYDPQTGIIYVGTGQPSPDWNATTRPGLDLWSSSVLAIDETTGKLVWAFQTSPHDLSDYDCSWSVMLANVTVDGQIQKVVMKGCKNGYFYALNAATGKMLWYFDAPSIARAPASAILDPTNRADMTKPWANYPSTKPYVQNPCHSGGIESDPAYDPVNNVAVVVTYNCPLSDSIAPTIGPGVPYGSFGLDLSYSGPSLPWNTTVWAINVDTGKPLWQYPIPDIGFRGGVDVSGGLVLVPAADGYLRALDEQNGQLVMQRNIGAALCTEPAIGQDIAGQEELVFPVCNGNDDQGLPVANGVMIALTPMSVATNATTSTTSVVMTSYVTTSSGISSAAFFSVAAVAVVFMAATGVLAARRRRP